MLRHFVLLLVVLLSLTTVNGDPYRRRKLFQDQRQKVKTAAFNKTESSEERRGRLFSLFSVVTFKQDSCTLSSDSTKTGTCMTSSECSSKSGNKDGNCASGFGVCCSFVLKTCPATITQNCTYVQNPEYPAATTETSCALTFNRIESNLCQIRLDFLTLTTAQPPTTVQNGVGLCGNTNTDTLTATSPSGKNPPVICGDLTGKHMFIETGTSGTAGRLDLAFGSASATRIFQIKVTYYNCDSLNKAPADCVEYYTGTSGTITSYNWPNQMLAQQFYGSCIRQESGYCGVIYQQSTITASNTFQLIGDTANTVGTVAVMDPCTQTFITIPNALQSTLTGTAAMATSRFCGGILSQMEADTVPGSVIAYGTPFRINTFTEEQIGPANGITFDGYSIDFSLKPCGTELA